MFASSSMPDQEWWHALWPDPKAVVLSLGIQPNMVSLDLCCGDGYFTAPLAQSSLRTYGLELDEELLEKAQKEAKGQNIRNCKWIQGDAMNIAASLPEKVDFVLLANTFHGVPHKETLGKRIYSILKPKGQLVIVNWHKRKQDETTVLSRPRGPKTEMRMTPLEAEDILVPLGFTLHKIMELPLYHYAIVFIK